MTNPDANPLEVYPAEEIKKIINLHHDLRKVAEKQEYQNVKGIRIDEKLDYICIDGIINILSKNTEKIDIEDPLMKIISESKLPAELEVDITNKFKPNKFFMLLKLIFEHPIIAGTIATVVGSIIVLAIQKRYFP